MKGCWLGGRDGAPVLTRGTREMTGRKVPCHKLQTVLRMDACHMGQGPKIDACTSSPVPLVIGAAI
jgi:hypothetical protein